MVPSRYAVRRPAVVATLLDPPTSYPRDQRLRPRQGPSYSLDPADWLAFACTVVGRDLTKADGTATSRARYGGAPATLTKQPPDRRRACRGRSADHHDWSSPTSAGR